MEDGPSSCQGRCRRASGVQANFAATLTEAAVERVVAFDEGRFGLKLWFWRRWCTFGHRPPWIVDDRYEWVWVYIAVTPQSGECCCLLLPHVDTECLNLFLKTVREEWPEEQIGIVLDGSGSHWSGSQAVVCGGSERGLRALGPEPFAEGVGHFWGIVETCGYMRACQGLAEVLWVLDEREKERAVGELMSTRTCTGIGRRFRLGGHEYSRVIGM